MCGVHDGMKCYDNVMSWRVHTAFSNIPASFSRFRTRTQTITADVLAALRVRIASRAGSSFTSTITGFRVNIVTCVRNPTCGQNATFSEITEEHTCSSSRLILIQNKYHLRKNGSMYLIHQHRNTVLQDRTDSLHSSHFCKENWSTKGVCRSLLNHSYEVSEPVHCSPSMRKEHQVSFESHWYMQKRGRVIWCSTASLVCTWPSPHTCSHTWLSLLQVGGPPASLQSESQSVQQFAGVYTFIFNNNPSNIRLREMINQRLHRHINLKRSTMSIPAHVFALFRQRIALSLWGRTRATVGAGWYHHSG